MVFIYVSNYHYINNYIAICLVYYIKLRRWLSEQIKIKNNEEMTIWLK
jgi:hypothetical protein